MKPHIISNVSKVRPPACAGRFYPADATELRQKVRRLLAAAKAPDGPAPKAIIAPQAGLDGFTLVPLLVGDVGDEEVAELLAALWDGPETCIVVSSDLSHYHDYQTARLLDQTTARAIEAIQAEQLDGNQACGVRPIR